jgi:hypothetical protein
MNKRYFVCFFLFISAAVKAQESELVVRYDFIEKAEPPMKVFYVKVSVDGVFADSSKPHLPNHNLANTVKTKVSKGVHHIRIEGFVKEEKDKEFVTSVVMEWNGKFTIKNKKCRILIKMNDRYEVVLYTVPDF